MKKILKQLGVPALSAMSAFILCMAGIYFGLSKNAQLVNNITGILVIILAIFSYIYYNYYDTLIKKLPKYLISTGLFMILIEYIASVFFKINLNVNVSIFWCDSGLIFFLLGTRWEYIKRIFKKNSRR